MNHTALRLKEPASKRGNQASFPRVFHVLLATTLLLSGTSQMTAAHAASQAQQGGNVTTTYIMRIQPPKPPICAGREYPVTVEVQSKSQGIIDGQQANFGEILYGVTVDAHTTNTSVATVVPDRLVTGDPLLAAPGGDTGPAEAEFTLQAQKAGTTSLVLETMVTRANNSYLSGALPINVIACDYKVTLTSSWSWSLSAGGVTLYSHLAQTSQGGMQRPGSGDALNGTAQVEWAMSSFAPGCSQSHDISPSTAHLDGTASEDGSTLTVRVTFDPATITSTHCVGGETGQFAPPPIEFTVPISGGSQGKDHSFQLGEENLHGYTAIQVTPVGNP